MLRKISMSSQSNNLVKGQKKSEKSASEAQNDRFAQNFMSNLKLFFEDSRQGSIDFLSDFTLTSMIDGKEHKAHKIILASQSKYFRGLFRNNPSTSSVSLEHEHTVIDACLEGIYTGIVPLTEDSVQDVLIASDYLGIDDLVRQSTNFIISHMDDSNCYDILLFGCDQGNKKLASSAASYIGEGLYDSGENNEELFSLPSKIFSKVLKSNGLIIKQNPLGVTITGLLRELHILPIIEKYIQKHPENKFEDFVSCCRLDGFDGHNAGKPELVKQTLLIMLLTNISRAEKVAAVKRAVQISQESNERTSNAVSIYEEEIVKFCDKLPEGMKTKFIGYLEKDQIVGPVSMKDRHLNRCTTQFTKAYGSAQDVSENIRLQNNSDTKTKIGIIRRLVVHTRNDYDGRNIIKGMEVNFAGDDESVKFGLDDGPGNLREEFILAEDEYIIDVEGRAGFYVDQLTFVTNKKRKLGPVGGSGGSPFSTVQQSRHNNKEVSKMMSYHLRGIQATKVHTQNRDTIARVRFLMCFVYDKEQSHNSDFAELLDRQYSYDQYDDYDHSYDHDDESSNMNSDSDDE